MACTVCFTSFVIFMNQIFRKRFAKNSEHLNRTLVHILVSPEVCDVLLSTLLSNTLSLCSPLRVRSQVSLY
jgi:hypothetical protein